MLGTQLLVMGTMVAAAGGPREVKALPENLSDLLPGNIAAFVEMADSDRRLGSLTAEELDAVRDPAGHPEAFIDLLCPTAVVALVPPVTLVDVYGDLGATTWLLAGPGVVVDGEVQVPLGESLAIGETLFGGYLLNAGETTLLVIDGDGNETEIDPNEALAIMCSYECSVGPCRDGRHACCYWTLRGGCARCTCVQDGKLPEPLTRCDSGGEGAVNCSMKGSDQY